jgi:hypothetical protein
MINGSTIPKSPHGKRSSMGIKKMCGKQEGEKAGAYFHDPTKEQE